MRSSPRRNGRDSTNSPTFSRDEEGDTIYAIDVVSEDMLLEFFEGLSRDHSFVLIAEGLRGPMVFPRGSSESSATWRIIVDPIDGTRGLMYQKRSAWILTGVAPNRGETTSLQDIVVAVQTEIPLIKQHLSDQMWAIKGQGACGRALQSPDRRDVHRFNFVRRNPAPLLTDSRRSRASFRVRGRNWPPSTMRL